ncbi:MAG TPA: HAMP domain-containing methyl-accepting chemotaxis protein [Thermoanaerobaculia bacterium]|jgi:methyl-accepting chemotaxis protein|nr:HAMP domain-containing methyl-accepting chemotaxis protein [Thermoanaerobaculia bacterium]
MLSGAPTELPRRRVGLRPKFVLAFVVQTVVIAVLIVGFVQWRVRNLFHDQLLARAEGIARTVAVASDNAMKNGRVDELLSVAADIKARAWINYADFVTADGRIVAKSEGTAPANVTVTPGRSDLLDSDGAELHLFVMPIASGGFFRLVANEREAMSVVRQLRLANLGVALLALLAAAALASLGSRFIVRPVLHLAENARNLSQGDLTQRAEIASSDEIGDLASAFNAMAANLEKTVSKLVRSQAQLKTVVETVGSRSRTVAERVDEQRSMIDSTYHSIDQLNNGVRKITDNVEALSAASEETSSSMLEMVASIEEVSRHTDTLYSSVEDTASATGQMATSINEVDQNVDFLSNFVTDTSSSMVEMSASIAQVESNAAKSYDLALAVADAAESGMKAVRETIDGMEQIRHSVSESNAVITRLGERSTAIGKILNVIEDIAEQTNLLALNAAILAASAGEHGKGFSVVAAEIRDLSERTASSTREIANLIRSVQDEVGNALRSMSAGTKLVADGVSLSHEAGKALNNILESSTKASEMGKEIAAATREQAKGSETVTQSVGRLQELVRQINGATTQQAQGSDHIMRAVESMREVTRYVRQAMVEQRSGSSMISASAERMIDMIHEIFQVAAGQATESEKIVGAMERVRAIAEGNGNYAMEMGESLTLLSDAIRGLDEEIRRFRVRG